MATIVVRFTDGSPDYTYDVEDKVKAKSYAHGITTGRGFRRPEDGRLIYFPLHRIKEVHVVEEGQRSELKKLHG